MTVEEALPYLKEHQQELIDRIYRGKYTPSPVRRATIPKQDGPGLSEVMEERRISGGFYNLATAYQSCTSTIETAVYRTVRTVV